MTINNRAEAYAPLRGGTPDLVPVRGPQEGLPPPARVSNRDFGVFVTKQGLCRSEDFRPRANVTFSTFSVDMKIV